MYDELVKRLRYKAGWDETGVFNEAADAIEELQGKLFMMKKTAEWLAEKMPKWIPVAERLPEKPGSYLVYVYGDVTEMNFWHGKWHILGDDHTKSVTHWMPLPEPPKEET